METFNNIDDFELLNNQPDSIIENYNLLSLREYDLLNSNTYDPPTKEELEEYLKIISFKEILKSKLPPNSYKTLGTKIYKK